MAAFPEVAGEPRHRQRGHPLQHLRRPQVKEASLRRGNRLVHRLAGQRMPKRQQTAVVLVQQTGGKHLREGSAGLLRGERADRAERRGVARGSEHGGRPQHPPGIVAEPCGPLQHRVAHGRRYLDPVEPPADPGPAPAGEIGPVVHQPHRLLDRQRQASGVPVQERREVGRDGFPREHRRHQSRGLLRTECGQVDPTLGGAGRLPRRQPQQQRVERQVLRPVRHQQAGVRHRPGGEEQQQLDGGVVSPVHVLDHEDRDGEPVQYFGQCPEEPVPGGPCVVQRFRRRRQVSGPLGEQRAQGSRQAAEPQAGDPVGGQPQRVHHRPERVRLAVRRTGDHQRPLPLSRWSFGRRREEFLHQPTFADTCFAADQYDRGRTGQRFGERRQLALPADESR